MISLKGLFDLNKYMNKILWLAVGSMMVFSPVIYANEQGKAETNVNQQTVMSAVNSYQSVSRPEISGLWGMSIPNNKRCVEYYNFKNNNQVVINSGKEWSTGLYDYQPQEAEVAPVLVLQIKYDNNEVDCSGRKEDQTGEISQYYVNWKSPSVINFCDGEKGKDCFATLQRILP